MHTCLQKSKKWIKWALHFQDMVLNKLSHKEVYIVSDANQVGNGDIKIVSPTEQAVEQAKSSLKRKLIINPPSKVKKKKQEKPSVWTWTSKR